VSYISYRYPSKDSETLDSYLHQANLRPITQQPRSPKDNTQQLRTLNQEQYQAALMKAIYRMCCIGLIEDFTQDYVNQEFRIVTRKKPDGAYYDGLKQFFMRYYNENRANAQIAYCKKYNGTEIANCLFFLTQFIYKKIATKRKQAIEDIEQFCKEATQDNADWLAMNEELKDTLYYYFNSKYARHEYKDETGQPYSLVDDTQSGKEWFFTGSLYNLDTSKGKDFEQSILLKYMRIINSDGVSSPKDNIKHLRGAIRLIRRGILSPNPILSLLNVFCLLFLKADETSIALKDEIEVSFIEGYEELRKSLSQQELQGYIENYLDILKKYNGTDDRHIEYLGLLIVMCEAVEHAEWAHHFYSKFHSINFTTHMTPQEILASLSRLESELQEVASARLLVEQTTLSYKEVQHEIRLFVAEFQNVVNSLNSISNAFDKGQSSLSDEAQRSIENIKTQLSTVHDSFANQCNNVIARFIEKTTEAGNRFSAETVAQSATYEKKQF